MWSVSRELLSQRQTAVMIMTFLLHYSGRGTIFSYRKKRLSEHQSGVCESQLVQDETQRWPHFHWELYSCQKWQDRHHPHQYLRYERRRVFFFSAQPGTTEYIQCSVRSSVYMCFFLWEVDQQVLRINKYTWDIQLVLETEKIPLEIVFERRSHYNDL